MNKENVREFANLAYTRLTIYIKKKYGAPKPWTDDRVLQDYFFCNVFREQDKTSEWIIKNIIEKSYEDEHLWTMLMVARYISRVDVLEDLEDAEAFCADIPIEARLWYTKARLLNRYLQHKPLNTGAFITSPMFGDYGPTKAHYIYNVLMRLKRTDFGEILSRQGTKMESIYDILVQLPAIGSFMAHQYCVDFSYVAKYLQNASDIYTWTAPGPGSMRGMARMLDEDLHSKISKEKWLYNACVLREEWTDYVESTFDHVVENIYGEVSQYVDKENVRSVLTPLKCLRMQDVQHWLCEYDKYKRGGSSKRRYHGR